jgi:hypothetical protein
MPGICTPQHRNLLTVIGLHGLWEAEISSCVQSTICVGAVQWAFSEHGAVAEAAESHRIIQVRLLGAGKSHFTSASGNSTNARAAGYLMNSGVKNGIRQPYVFEGLCISLVQLALGSKRWLTLV